LGQRNLDEIRDNSSNPQDKLEQIAPSRLELAKRVPFFLRCWYLKDYQESADLDFGLCGVTTGGTWSATSDPLCDLGNWDYP
jgi:hypothetical protein